jgi:hypothetical protein
MAEKAEAQDKPEVDPKTEGLKIKKKVGRPRKLVKEVKPIKVDLTKKKEDAVQEQGSDAGDAIIEQPTNKVNSEKVVEEVREPSTDEASVQEQNEKQEEVKSPLMEVTEEETKEEEPIVSAEVKTEKPVEHKPEKQLPENIEKLISFMEETGGTVEDYVRINADYSNVDESVLLREYYKTTKPHLNSEEIDFILEDNFSWDEESDEDRYIRYQVNNVEDVVKNQSNIQSFVKKFLNEDGSIKDTNGYHKALYVARNPDTFAQHFYEQGKADAIRDINSKSKNIDMQPHNSAGGDIFVGGFKVRAINGQDSSKLKIKKRTK